MIRIAATAVLALVVGCAPSQAYIEADRVTYEAIAPIVSRCVHDHPGWTESGRALTLHGLERWDERITAFEEQAP